VKQLVTLIFVIFPLISFGECLDINGSYTCKGLDGTYNLTVSTNFIDGVYSYNFTQGSESTEVFSADGKDWPFEEEIEEGIKVKGTFKTVCDASSINIHMSGKIGNQDQNTDLKITAKIVEDMLYLRHRILFNSRILDTMIDKCTLN